MRRLWVGLGLATVGLVTALCTAKVPDGSTNGSVQAAGSAKPVWSEPIEVAIGPAYQGPWKTNESEFHYVDDPTVAVGDGGLIAVAWAEQTRRDVLFQVFDTKGAALLAAPVNVSRNAEIFSWLPRVALAAEDPTVVYVVWQELIFSGGSHGGDIFFARSTDGGRSFETPVNLSSSITGDGKGRVSLDRWDNGSLDVVAGPPGEIHVAWTEYEGALWYRRSSDRGRTFTERIRIAGDRAAPARAPSLAVSGEDVHLSWTVIEGAAPGIRLATSSDGGATFGAPVVVGEKNVPADAPKLAVDGEGTVHLVYAEMPLRSVHGSGILYTRRPVGAETFAAPRRITRSGSAGYPSLAIDREAGVYVAWERFPTIEGRPLGLGFVHSRDAGRTFSSPLVVPHTDDVQLGFNGSLQGALMRKLAVTENGTVAVVNSSFREGMGSRVRLILGRLE